MVAPFPVALGKVVECLVIFAEVFIFLRQCVPDMQLCFNFVSGGGKQSLQPFDVIVLPGLPTKL